MEDTVIYSIDKSDIISDKPREVSFQQVMEITNNFEQKLGSGTFGVVYKGVLNDGPVNRVIAVKKLHSKLQHIDGKQFKNEYELLRMLKHQNIVRLVGFCNETEKVHVQYEGRIMVAEEIHRALCLEFVPNGSLGKFLSEQRHVLNWNLRFKIIKGICEGLKYLHDVPINHLDLKLENILLDDKMAPKIADFGMSRLMGAENTVMTQTSLGTLGYIPPEFIKKQIISREFDIFSLGVIIGNILMLDPRIFFSDSQECIEHVHSYWKKELQGVPGYASPEEDCKQVRTCIEIAVVCMDEDPRKRPTMKYIVHKLNKLELKENDSSSPIEQDFCTQITMEDKSDVLSDQPMELSFRELMEITNNFKQELGRGTFGVVYKGVLNDGRVNQVTAVKKLHSKLQHIDGKQFKNEYELLRMLKHQNIVQLVGVCDETEKVIAEYQGRMVVAEEIHRALCLEFVPNGSLRKFLSEQRHVLNWNLRLKIIKGICEGLKYLHDVPINHLDLKPDNILLDDKMAPKIADFGISRLMGAENTVMTQTSLGTLGYIPPEFIKKQIISREFDIFSLGVIIGNILMLDPSIFFTDSQECIEHVHSYWKKELQGMPGYASPEADCKQVRTCIEIAVVCMDEDPRRRPTMNYIVHKLNKLEFKENDSFFIEQVQTFSPRCAIIILHCSTCQFHMNPNPSSLEIEDLVVRPVFFGEVRQSLAPSRRLPLGDARGPRTLAPQASSRASLCRRCRRQGPRWRRAQHQRLLGGWMRRDLV